MPSMTGYGLEVCGFQEKATGEPTPPVH